MTGTRLAAAAALTMLSPLSPLIGAQGSTGGHSEVGNNLAVPAVFAEGIGLTGFPTAEDTGLRPRPGEPVPVPPYFDQDATETREGVLYYLQRSTSVWQADWRNGGEDEEHVTVRWSSNLLSHRWSPDTRIQVGVALETVAEPPMLGYPMIRLSGSGPDAVWGTTGLPELFSRATVFTATARLRIEKLDGPGGSVVHEAPSIDLPVAQSFGRPATPDRFRGHVTRCGLLDHRYRWPLADWPGSREEKLGWWRLTFSVASPAQYVIDRGIGDERMRVKRNVRFIGVSTRDPGGTPGEHEDETPLFEPRIHGRYKSTLEVEIADHGGTHDDGDGDTCGAGHPSGPV